MPKDEHTEGHLEYRLKHLEGIITGDGEKMGVGPLVLRHEKEINGRDGLAFRVRKLEDRDTKLTAYVAGAVAAVTIIINLVFKFWH